VTHTKFRFVTGNVPPGLGWLGRLNFDLKVGFAGRNIIYLM